MRPRDPPPGRQHGLGDLEAGQSGVPASRQSQRVLLRALGAAGIFGALVAVVVAVSSSSESAPPRKPQGGPAGVRSGSSPLRGAGAPTPTAKLRKQDGLALVVRTPTQLIDPDSGRSLAVALFETEEDLRKGDEALNAMNPEPGDEVGKRTSVEKYEVAVDVRL